MLRCALVFLSLVALAVGEIATIQDLPYRVSIIAEKQYVCPGVILNSKVILTAATCTALIKQYPYSIMYGGQNAVEGTEVEVERYLEYPGYDWSTIENDIALLFLASEIKFGPNAQPITIASETPAAGTPAQITGRLSKSSLETVNVSILDIDACSQEYEHRLKDTQMCAIGNYICDHATNPDVLVKDNKLIGFIANTLKCYQGEYIGIFTDLSTIRPWIVENAGL